MTHHPRKRTRRTTPTLARIFRSAAVGSPTECWPWTGALQSGAYPVVWIGAEERARLGHGADTILVSRYLLATLRGRIGRGVVAMHTCDRPDCVNPSHLAIATQAENMRDASRKGRLGGPRRGRLSRGEVLDLRARAVAGESITAIARATGLRPVAVSRAVRARTYRDVECVV